MCIAKPTDPFDRYEALLQPRRRAFATRPAIAMLKRGIRDPSLLHLFLMYFAAFGVSMTRPVEDWMRRAGRKCLDLGMTDTGNALIGHARHEAGHHELMVADLWALADRWNADRTARIDPIAFGRGQLPDSVARYAALHESTSAGEAPCAQLAIEYEIEALSVRHGPALLAAAAGVLDGVRPDEAIRGDGERGKVPVPAGVSFLREHVALDAAHTAFNRAAISRLLAARPDRLGAMADAGAAALDIYGAFIDDCLQAALTFDGDRPGEGLECRLYAPPGPPARSALPEWLVRVRSLRSHVLYDGGARPAFGPGGCVFGDPDEADLHCHHLVLVDSGLPVGAVRLRAPGGGGPSLVETTFGRGPSRRSLGASRLSADDCAEASRLVLHPDSRRGHTVRRLFAGMWALAAELGATAIWAGVGTAGHQDRLFSLFGAQMLDGAGSVHVPQFDDTLRLALFRIDRENPPRYAELDHMRAFVRRAVAADHRRAA